MLIFVFDTAKLFNNYFRYTLLFIKIQSIDQSMTLTTFKCHFDWIMFHTDFVLNIIPFQ